MTESNDSAIDIPKIIRDEFEYECNARFHMIDNEVSVSTFSTEMRAALADMSNLCYKLYALVYMSELIKKEDAGEETPSSEL